MLPIKLDHDFQNVLKYIKDQKFGQYEPQHEKTCLWGFRTGLTETGLYNHRRWLEA